MSDIFIQRTNTFNEENMNRLRIQMNEDFSLIKQEQNMEKREVEHQLKELIKKYNYNRKERIRLEDVVVDLTEDIKTLLHGGNTF